jgi:3-oxoacyl-[acyl-carrier-protein] synthase II
VSSHDQRRDPVVTGIGAITPVGKTAPETWQALLEGRSGVTPIESFDASDLPVRIAGEIHGFDAEALLGPKRFRRSARFSQLAIAAAREAVADAGLDTAAEADQIGVVVNAAVGGEPETERNVRALVERGPRDVSPYFVPSTILNMAACEVAIDLGVHGPVNASALACASGTAALLEARRLIASGEADVVIAGGTDAGISRSMIAGLAVMGPLSERNDAPEEASRPFDADRDGFVFGEGAVVLVVESAEHAQARGARAYGTVAGGALTSDAFHISAPEPSGVHAARAIELALRNAGVTPEELDYICAHGTATKANDASETRAIRMALGARADDVPASSPKSMVGHLIGAAGALSAMVCLLAIRDGIVPPTTNLHTPDPQCDLDYVPLTARRVEVRTAAANAFGFGGQNCVIVMGTADEG